MMSGDSDEIAICSGCNCQMDVSVLAPFTNVQCPECGVQNRVKCELDQYILRRRQGVGGMSLVFAAKDKNLGREVAIKVLNEDYSSDSTRITQFEQEAMITAGISHPHVVRVYTVGKAFNRYYIAMELVSGQSMEQIMAERGAIPEEEVIPKMLQVTEGLHAAYKVNLIHRDIKPGNILIDHLNMAKIVDFGLALVTQGGVATAEEIWATPYYVPPEALDGQPEDFRSDVYALSATMYHALAGKPPFTTETRNTRELSEIKKSLPPLKTVAPWLSDSICAVIDKGMQFSPQDRFASYEEMLEAVQFAEDTIGQEGTTLPVHGTERAKRRSAEPSKAIKIGVPIALGVIALAIGGYFLITSIVASQPGDLGGGAIDSDPVEPVGTVTIDKELRAKVSKGYSDALAHLEQGNYFNASETLYQSLKLENHPEPSASLAGLHNVAVRMLGGSPRRAREAADELRAHAENAEYNADIFSKEEIVGACSKIRGMGAYRTEHAELGASKEGAALLLFIAGMKNAEQGMWRLASDQFESFIGNDFSELPKQAGFFEVYQKEASRYLKDIATLTRHQKMKFSAVKSKSQAESLKRELDAVALESKMKRGKWAIKQYHRKYNTIIKYYEKIDTAQPVDPVPDPVVKKTFDNAKKLLADDLASRQYEVVVRKLLKMKFDDEDDEKKKQHFIYLCNHAKSYYEGFAINLIDKSIRKPIKSSDGKEYKSIRKVLEDGFLVSENGKPKELKFAEVDPSSMLSLHGDLVKDLMDFQQNNMLENAVCFAYLNGLKEKARKAAKILSSKDSFFEARWAECVITLEH